MSRTTALLLFLLGIIVGSLAQRPASAFDSSILLMGTSSTGTPKAITVDASGNLNVHAN